MMSNSRHGLADRDRPSFALVIRCPLPPVAGAVDYSIPFAALKTSSCLTGDPVGKTLKISVCLTADLGGLVLLGDSALPRVNALSVL